MKTSSTGGFTDSVSNISSGSSSTYLLHQPTTLSNSTGFNSVKNNTGLLNNNKVNAGIYSHGLTNLTGITGLSHSGFPQTSSFTKQNFPNYYGNSHILNNNITNSYSCTYNSQINLAYYQQQQKNLSQYKTVTNTTLPYHSNLLQCNNQNFNNKSVINDAKKGDEVKKAMYTIKDIPEMTVGSFLSNKNMQQMYFDHIKNPGKEPESLPITSINNSMEVKQVIVKPPVKTNPVTSVNQVSQVTPGNQLRTSLNPTINTMLNSTSNPIMNSSVTPTLPTLTQINQMAQMGTLNRVVNVTPGVRKQKNVNHTQYTPNFHQIQPQPEIPPNTPKGFYIPSSGEKNSQLAASNTNNTNNVINPNHIGMNKQKNQNINITIPNYPSVTNFNIQNYNFNNFNSNMPTSTTSFSTQQITTSNSTPELDSNKFASSNLNLTTASGKSINIQKTSTIPKNNALVKTGQKLRVNLTETPNTLESTNLFSKDFIPLKSSNMTEDAPESLKHYIVRSFEKCQNEKDRKKCEQALQRIISNAKKKGQLHTRNWNKFLLPKLPNEIEENVKNSKIFINFFHN